MNIEIRDKAREMAEVLRDECDGSYVGAEQETEVTINGVDVKIEVCAFWEKSFWFDYKATGDGFKEFETVYC